MNDLDKLTMQQQLELAGLPAPRCIGIDAISLGKGDKYWIVVSDLDLERPIWIGDGGGKEADIDLFFRHLGEKKCAGIELAAIDTKKSFRNSVLRNAPQARIILDKFHVMLLLSKALDEVRGDEYKRLSSEEGSDARGQLDALPSKRETLNLDGGQALEKRTIVNRRLHAAELLKQTFEQLWETRNEREALTFFVRWKAQLKRQGLEPYRKFAVLVETHWQRIGSHLHSESTVPQAWLRRYTHKLWRYNNGRPMSRMRTISG